ncbi:MAG: SRPBCC family protein [Ahniella sp.]|nr:SRPBCC family protein [Ahniella sp.]
MVSIQVEHWFPSGRSLVFNYVSDHERFLAAPGLVCKVAEPGSTDRNGNDAIRVVRSGLMSFRERVIDFDPEQRFGYRIEDIRFAGLRMPFQHEGGLLEFADLANGTRVRWTSRLAITMPLLGGFLERDFQARATHLFAGLLRTAAQKLST